MTSAHNVCGFLFGMILLVPIYACDVTDEYTQFANEIAKGFNNSYKKCLASVANTQYWARVSECVKAVDGTNVGGGCEHMVGNPTLVYDATIVTDDHCSVLDSSSYEVRVYTEQLAEVRGIKKCK